MTTDTPPPEKQPDGQPQGRWKVVRIDTAPMTNQQYDQAVTALATLIAQWRHDRENSQENTGADLEESA